MSRIRSRKLLFLSALILVAFVMQLSMMQTVSALPTISLNPISGAVTQSVTITGSGFAGSGVLSCQIHFASVSHPTYNVTIGVCAISGGTIVTPSTGFTVPTGLPEIPGVYAVTIFNATDQSDISASTPFQVIGVVTTIGGTVTTVTGTSTNGGYSIGLYPSVWQCMSPEQLTFSGPVLENGISGHQLSFQFIQQGTGAGYQSRIFYSLPETFYDDNVHIIWLNANVLNGIDFSLMPQVTVQIIDTSLITSSNPSPPPLATYNAYAAGLNVFQCNQVFTSNNNYNTNTGVVTQSSTTQVLSFISSTTSTATQFVQSTVTNPAVVVGTTSTSVVTSVAVSTSVTTVSGFSALDWGLMAGLVAVIVVLCVLGVLLLRRGSGVLGKRPNGGSSNQSVGPSEPASAGPAGKVWSVQQKQNFDVQFAAGRINEEMLNDALSTGLLSQAEHLYYMNLLNPLPPAPPSVVALPSPSPAPVVPSPVTLGPVKSAKRKK